MYKTHTKLILLVLLLAIPSFQLTLGMASSGNQDVLPQYTNQELQTDQVDDQIQLHQPQPIKVKSTIPINVVFLGTNQSYIDETKIDQNLTKHYTPTVAQKNYLYLGANYSLDFNYFYSSQQMETDFVTYIDSISTESSAQTIALQELNANYDPNPTSAFYISAEDTLSWLDNSVNDYFGQDINSTYTMYIIDTFTDGYITSDYYFYETSIRDPDTGLPSGQPYSNYWGGDYPSRGVFLDLSAGPVYYNKDFDTRYPNDHPENEGVSDVSIQPIWEYDLSTQAGFDAYSYQLSEYIMETTDLVFSPSYLYIPEIREDFEIEIFMFDETDISLDGVVNPPIIQESFEFLVPSFDVSVQYTVTSLSQHTGLQQVIDDNTQLDEDGNGAYNITSRPVVEYLMSNQGEFGITDNTFPVYIFTWDDNKWLSDVGTLGIGTDDGEGNPEMVLMGYPVEMGYSWENYTTTIIHEVGHLTSLRHPHDGFSWDRYNDSGDPFIVDQLPDFISTPMTYANPDSSFSTFDADQLDRGYAINRINSTWWNLAQANETLQDKNYTNLNQTSIEISDALSWSLGNLSLAQASFDDLDYLDAFYYANLSHFNALSYYDSTSSFEDYVEPMPDTDPEGRTGTVSRIHDEDGGLFDLPVFFPVIVLAIPVLLRKVKKE